MLPPGVPCYAGTLWSAHADLDALSASPPLPGGRHFDGSCAAGTACRDWADQGNVEVVMGTAGATDSAWINAGTMYCSEPAGLYCLRQPAAGWSPRRSSRQEPARLD